MGTDRDWKKWGQADPYFGVLSNEAFRSDRLNQASREAFFATGDAHVAELLKTIRSHFDADFVPGTTLDFGCGVGRLLIPFARVSARAVGLDISQAMLDEAKANAEQHGLSNVELRLSDDQLSEAEGRFDLVHSHIVLVHIPTRRGMQYLSMLARKVAPGGYLAVQVLFACHAPWWKRLLVRASYALPPLNMLRNLARGRRLREPAMQLHVYPMHEILPMLSELGFGPALLPTEKLPDGSFSSAVVIARREA